MTDSHSDPVRHKFATARRDLSAALIDRDDEIDLALTALVAGEHVLLVGPPGTAKSLLLDAVARFLDGRRFACLLTKFTQPDELFGPIRWPACARTGSSASPPAACPRPTSPSSTRCSRRLRTPLGGGPRRLRGEAANRCGGAAGRRPSPTVYRWMTDPEFVKAMRVAAQEFFRRCRERVDAEEAERKRWRQERERARRPMRCANLANARAAMRRE